MPTHKKHVKKGKGWVKEFFENVGNKIKNGVSSAHHWMQDKKPLSKLLDIPILGWMIKSTPVGIPMWAVSKIGGYGKKTNKGNGRHKRVGRPRK